VVLLGDEGQAKAHFDLFGDSLNPMQDRCTVCDHCTNGMEIALGAPDGGNVCQVEACFSLFGDSVVPVQERTIGLKINLDAPDGTPR
jgi:hypothetical protein